MSVIDCRHNKYLDSGAMLRYTVNNMTAARTCMALPVFLCPRCLQYPQSLHSPIPFHTGPDLHPPGARAHSIPLLHDLHTGGAWDCFILLTHKDRTGTPLAHSITNAACQIIDTDSFLHHCQIIDTGCQDIDTAEIVGEDRGPVPLWPGGQGPNEAQNALIMGPVLSTRQQGQKGYVSEARCE